MSDGFGRAGGVKQGGRTRGEEMQGKIVSWPALLAAV
jgi:hypothetical protein